MIIMRVGEDDGGDLTVTDNLQDCLYGVRSVDDHALGVVTDHPHVVVDVEGLAVERERPRGDGVIDPGRHQKITTERRTPPVCIFSNASSTWSRRISSDTKASRSTRPCR